MKSTRLSAAALLTTRLAFSNAADVNALNLRCHVTDSDNIVVAWDAVSSATSYEVQVAASTYGKPGAPFLASYTDATYIDVKDLHHDRTYYFNMRYHKTGYRKDEGWSDLSQAVTCKVPPKKPHSAAVATPRASNPAEVDTFHIQVVREARGEQPDYLSEHNAANYAGESSFLSGHAHAKSLLQLFCVELMHPPNEITGRTTTGSHTAFANYASCQKPQYPEDAHYMCNKINDADCRWLRLSADQCKGARTPGSWDYSSRFIGLGYANTSSHHPRLLYSFPRATECRGDAEVGSSKDGVMCTWKARGEFRLAAGKANMTVWEMNKAFSEAPMARFSCGNSEPPLELQTTIV